MSKLKSAVFAWSLANRIPCWAAILQFANVSCRCERTRRVMIAWLRIMSAAANECHPSTNCFVFSKSVSRSTWFPPRSCRWRQYPLTPNGKVIATRFPNRAQPSARGRSRDAARRGGTQAHRDLGKRPGRPPIGIEDKFFDLGGHSFAGGQIDCTNRKSLRSPAARPHGFPIAHHRATGGGHPPKKIQEGSALAGTSLVEIQARGTRPPLFLVHGAGGGMFWGYVNLSRHLGTISLFMA